ncbi:MAG TPA: glycosyl transferase family 1 [Brevundimonas sp.]|uniref:glycosyltransferase family 4 protein n=1 Tax=Brevundimonas sp. TaxID=1871086 RepID=UPI000E983AB8|nr:glycosyltransferase family 1 protein [Brevundimonas sp.]HBI19360.1 glycosyl transferase family 1 [Brevundimonas sp.]
MTRACIDGWNLSLAKGSGIATYGRNLAEALAGVGVEVELLHGPVMASTANALLSEVALTDARRSSRKAGLPRALSTILSRFGRVARPVREGGMIIGRDDALPIRRRWTAHDLFSTANRAHDVYGTFTPLGFRRTDDDHGTPDIMHWTTPLPLYARRAANVYTVHDLIPLKLPHTTLDNKKRYHDLMTSVVRRADLVLAVSETTRQDLIAMLGADERKVVTTYQAVTSPRGEQKSTDYLANELATLHGLEFKGYFLFFGAVEPKKNVSRLIQAYLESRIATPLVVVAGRDWLAQEDLALLSHASESASGVKRIDYLPAALLRNLIRGAKATLFPSLYEGFGLPILESMMAGTAVITANVSATAEVAGEAALTVDPRSIEAIRAAIVALDSDDDKRVALEAAGRLRADAFSLEAYQGRLRLAYQTLGFS